MGIIKQLDEVTINQIAAGEVIDRPASIVKELLENALDAGADRVVLTIEDGGREKIMVEDNGCGISQDDLSRAFLRHATSKLQVLDDLYSLGSFGFRGEALASISHVARVRLKSAQEKGQGAVIEAYQGEFSKPEPVSMAKGSKIEVATLFEDMPVRRRFLKSAGTELSHISELVLRFSLCHPTVTFILQQGSKILINTAGFDDRASLLRYHYGTELEGQLIPVDEILGSLRVEGIIASPQLTYSNKNKMIFSVNGRLLQSPLLHSAVMKVFHALIPARRFPLLYLNLSLDAAVVDVNVHPQKLDVKFLSSGFLYDALPKALTLSLQKGKFDKKGESECQLQKTESDNGRNFSNEQMLGQAVDSSSTLLDVSANEKVVPLHLNSSLDRSLSQAQTRNEIDPLKSNDFVKTQLTKPLDQASMLYDHDLFEVQTHYEFLQFFDTYLVLKCADGLYILDQHAVHERILYERFQEVSQDEQARHVLLLPETLLLDEHQYASFKDHFSLFEELNFIIEDFGDKQIQIREIPLLFIHVDVKQFAVDLLNDLMCYERSKEFKNMALKPYLETKACKAAIKAGKRMGQAELQALMKDFAQCPSKFTCPHGRPLYLRFDKNKLEKLFLRI